MRANTLQKVQAHDEGVWATAWVPGQSQLITGSVDESIKLWQTTEDKLECAHTFKGQALGVIAVDVDSSGAYAVSSSLDSAVRVIGLEDKALKHMVERQPTESWGAAFGVVTPESMQIAVAGGSKGQAFTYKGGAEEPALQLTLDLPQVCLAAHKASPCVVAAAAEAIEIVTAVVSTQATYHAWSTFEACQNVHVQQLPGRFGAVIYLSGCSCCYAIFLVLLLLLLPGWHT
jgi:WD repeat-containing protein 61